MLVPFSVISCLAAWIHFKCANLKYCLIEHAPVQETCVAGKCGLRYLALREKVELDSIPGMVFCPCCQLRTLSDPASPVVMCDSCHFPFCRTCRQTWHGPGACPSMGKVKNTPTRVWHIVELVLCFIAHRRRWRE